MRRLPALAALTVVLAGCGGATDPQAVPAGSSGDASTSSSGGASTRPSGGASTPDASAGPTAGPSTGSTPTPTPARWRPEQALVTPAAAGAAEAPGWQVRDDPPEPGPLLDPCREGRFPLADRVAASAERTLGSRREVGGSILVQEVFRYASPEDAAAALAEYAARVERCPTAPVPDLPDHTRRYEVVEHRPGERMLVRVPDCGPECNGLYVDYRLLVRSGDGLSVLRYGVGEDGDPGRAARALLPVAADALAAAVA